MKGILRYLVAEENTNKLVVAGIVLGILFGWLLPEWALAQKALGKAIVAMNLFPIGEPVSAEGLSYEKAEQVEPFSLSRMLLSFIPTNFHEALAAPLIMEDD